ncbi:hypothetical protein B5X24_HaOG209361 [Helicoverpa armigera]|nr:hypothetical protein B5X24_HaOG209361 [Helicoverpa armigera]
MSTSFTYSSQSSALFPLNSHVSQLSFIDKTALKDSRLYTFCLIEYRDGTINNNRKNNVINYGGWRTVVMDREQAVPSVTTSVG